jgi:tetratricopeptide (TPR) repeat protein/transglutaminase-like putative cysteine protease
MVRLVLALLVALWTTMAAAAEKPVYGPPPAWVKEAELPAPKADEGGATQFLLHDIQIRSSPDGVETYARGAVEIRTVQGLNAMGTIALPWSPNVDTLTVHHVRILRGGEAIDALANGATFTVLRREQNLERSMLDGVLTASFQPAGMRVGDILDFAFTLHRKDPAYQGRNEQLTAPVLDEPTRRVRVRALWPKDRPVRWRVAEGLPKPKLSTGRDGTELLIDVADVQPLKIPTDAPPRFFEVGYLEITEFEGWKDISALMAAPYAAAGTLAPDSPLRAEIEKIRSASADPKTRAAVALRLVQDQVRYVFQGMESGYLPASADETWSRRFGDCKGKSALLTAILRELGIEAEPALVSITRNDGLDQGLPLMQRFDHVIVRAVIDGKVYWLDGARVGDRDLDAQPSSIYRWALPLRAGGADLERLPSATLMKPTMATEFHFDASDGLDVPAPVRGSLTLRGDLATVLKATYDNLAGADRETFLRDYWKESYSWIEIEKAGLTYDDATGDVRLAVEGKADMKWAGSTGGLRRYEAEGGTLGWKRDYERDPGPYAEAPFSVNYPFFAEITQTIVLPHKGEGFTLVGGDIDRRVGAWELKRKSAIKDGVFTMTASTRSIAPELPFADLKAAEKPLAELAGDTLYVMAPYSYMATVEEVGAVAKKTPRGANELIERGAMFLNRGDLDRALTDLNEALRLQPRSALALANRGVTRFWKGDVQGASVDIDKALEIDPTEAVAYNGKGLLARHKGEHDKAIAAFTRATELRPNSDFAVLERARSYVATKRYEQALKDLDRVIKNDPANDTAHSLREDALLGLGRYDEVLAALDAKLAANPRDPVLLNNRCWTRAMANRDLAGGLADCEAVLKAEPDLAAALDSRALIYLRRGELDRAIADFDAALKRAPGMAPALFGRGVAKLRKGLRAEGQADLAAARASNPNIDAEFAAFGITP